MLIIVAMLSFGGHRDGEQGFRILAEDREVRNDTVGREDREVRNDTVGREDREVRNDTLRVSDAPSRGRR